jgi:hypothetical protein
MKNLRYFSESREMKFRNWQDILFMSSNQGPKWTEKLSRITESELQDLDDMFVIVSDTWDIVPVPTNGYESSSFFHGDYLMTLDGDGFYINLEIYKSGKITESMESSLSNFQKRLSRKGYSNSIQFEGQRSRHISEGSWIEDVSYFRGLIWMEKMNESVSTELYDLGPIFKEIDKFLNGTTRNIWISDDDDNPIFSIYVRKSKRFIGGLYRDFLDLATINILEDYQGRKIFQRFLRRLIDEYPNNIYVESILNPAVDHICSKFGFSPIGNDNMYLIQSESENQ